MGAWFRNAKPYLLLLAVQFGSVAMFIFAMDAINKGMSHYVFIVYRNAIAAITLSPFAFVLERKIRPKMSVRVFSEIMALAFFEIILDQCFALLGMKLTSASFPSAVMNSTPSVTFVLAVILRLERMKIKEVPCQAKVIGTAVTFGGTLLMALYKGPVVSIAGSAANHAGQHENVNDPTGSHWIIGTCFILIACAGISMFYILQAITLRKYPAEMSLATWVCFVGALQSSVTLLQLSQSVIALMPGISVGISGSLLLLTRLVLVHSTRNYFIKVIVTSGVKYYIQGMVIKAMGPVIVTAFNPLRMIIVTALACILLSEQLYLGRNLHNNIVAVISHNCGNIIGSIVVVSGLYLVVWGKAKEFKSSTPPSLTEEQDQLQKLSQFNKAQLVIHSDEEATLSKTENQQH